MKILQIFYHKHLIQFVWVILFTLASSVSFSQGLPLTILDAGTKEPLIGVHISNDDKKFGVYTNENGVAYIKGVSLDEYLNFSYLGYREERITLKDVIRSSDTILLEVLFIQFSEGKVYGSAVGVERRENIANQVQVVDAKKIALLNPQNSADLLQASGAFVQKSQMGGGSPIIRGFEANKLLIVIDGVRLNNAIYRNGHLQNVISIDNAVLDRVEIVQGPASVIYGSDALGGVMHFITKEPRLALRKGQEEIFEGSAYGRYSTVNNEKAVHLDFNYGTKKLALLSSISYSNFGDLRIGTKGMEDYPGFGLKYFYTERFGDGDTVVTNPNPLIQKGTGYSQFDALQKVKYQYSDELSLILNFQYSTTSDVPRFDQMNIFEVEENDPDLLTDNDTIPKFATWNYGPQTRLFLSAKARYVPDFIDYFDEATAILSFQKVDEDRIKRRFNKPNEVHQEEDVYVTGLNIDFTKIFNREKNQLILYGGEFIYNNVISDAYSAFPGGLVDLREQTRYPNDGSQMFSAAAYANYRQTFFDKLDIMAGSRYTYTTLKSQFDPDSIVILPFEEINLAKGSRAALTGSISASYELLDDFYIDAVAATAFRAPNVDDFGKIRSKNGYVTVPNENLAPEKSINFEASLTKRIKDGFGDRFLISGTYYYTYLVDVIVQDYFTLVDPVTLRDTNLLYIEGSYDTIQANVNGGQAVIQGISASLQWNPISNLQISSTLNIVQGRNVTDKENPEPLAHIPPMYGQTSITYETNNIEFTFLTRYNGWKRLEDYSTGSSDNLVYATPDGTPSWITFNGYLKYKISPKVTINLACENVRDTHYRPFSSGVSAPGRNFILTFRTKF
jgi:hemoglobin/transferrin/lactoferrin receptor protein